MNANREIYVVFQVAFYVLLLVALGLHPLRDFVESHIGFFYHWH